MRKQGSAAELETRRRLAGRLLLEGKTIGDVMNIVEASESSVKRWKRALKKLVLRQNLWVKIGQFNGGAGVDFVRDGRTNKWGEAKGALAA